jgi:DNA-binding CsgD family transcriptional regulator
VLGLACSTVPAGIELSAHEYELMLQLGEAFHCSLDLRVAIERAVPLLQRLVNVDHLALAVSRPGDPYDYEWFHTSLPESFLGNYAAFADQDFVRQAVAVCPNRVLRDHEMIARRDLERHVVYSYAHDAGANLEHVMAVMLSHGREWSSGLSLYRNRLVPFSDREAAILQMVVPQIKSAVCNARQHAALQREAWLEPAVVGAGLAAVWLDRSAREVARVGRVNALLEQYFPACRGSAVPEVLIAHLRRFLASRVPNKTPTEWIEEGDVSCLHVSFVPMPEHHWALVFRTCGIPPELATKLSPRLLEIAGCLLRGMSNEQIALRDNRSVATIKQQASEVCARLGVKGRKGLIQMAWGHVE